MTRPVKGPFGDDAPYPAGMVGKDVYDAEDLPPLTAAIREAWGNSAHPVPSAEALAAIFVAVHDIETRLTELESLTRACAAAAGVKPVRPFRARITTTANGRPTP
jgi:hypothetical protein